MNKKIIITIPAFNEEESIVKVIEEIKQIMDFTNYNYTILVVDDGSVDKTKELAIKAGAIVHSHKRNRGLATTFRTEMQKCIELKADIIVHTDADYQYPASYIPDLIKKIEEGYDLVLGSRFKGKTHKMSLMKKIGNYLFAIVFSQLIKMRLSDTTTGFRAFTRELAQEISFINDFTYTQEMIIRASKQGFKITEIPIKTRETRPSRLFKNSFEFAFKAWINIFRIYRDYDPIKFFGVFGSIFLITGILISIVLFINFLVTDKVGHIPTLILSVLLIITGIQIILFGFLADMHRKEAKN